MSSDVAKWAHFSGPSRLCKLQFNELAILSETQRDLTAMDLLFFLGKIRRVIDNLRVGRLQMVNFLLFDP